LRPGSDIGKIYLLVKVVQLSGFHPVEGVGGGSFPPKTHSFPPREKEETRERRERERRERLGKHIFFGAAIQVISNPLVELFLKALENPPKHIP
jgi:hypothetical protein